METLEQLMMEDIFSTIEQIACDCHYMLENDDYEANKDRIGAILEIKIGRIKDEVDKFENLILEGI